MYHRDIIKYSYTLFLSLINLKVSKRFLIKKILNEPRKTDLWQIKQQIDGGRERSGKERVIGIFSSLVVT